jgi:hypothetical protein
MLWWENHLSMDINRGIFQRTIFEHQRVCMVKTNPVRLSLHPEITSLRDSSCLQRRHPHRVWKCHCCGYERPKLDHWNLNISWSKSKKPSILLGKNMNKHQLFGHFDTILSSHFHLRDSLGLYRTLSSRTFTVMWVRPNVILDMALAPGFPSTQP